MMWYLRPVAPEMQESQRGVSSHLRVSQPWCFVLDNPLMVGGGQWACLVCSRMFSSILGLYLLKAHSPSPTALKVGQQKCLQMLSKVIQETSSSVIETTTILSKSWFNTILSLLVMVSIIWRQVDPCQMSNSPIAKVTHFIKVLLRNSLHEYII